MKKICGGGGGGGAYFRKVSFFGGVRGRVGAY